MCASIRLPSYLVSSEGVACVLVNETFLFLPCEVSVDLHGIVPCTYVCMGVVLASY